MYLAIKLFTATIWMMNGAYCKCVGGVPRHQQIVAAILGERHAPSLTWLIGMGEVGIACWILSGKAARACIICQVVLVAVMNIIEFVRVPHLLLFGHYNALLATALVWLLLCQLQQLKRRSKSLSDV